MSDVRASALVCFRFIIRKFSTERLKHTEIHRRCVKSRANQSVNVVLGSFYDVSEKQVATRAALMHRHVTPG